MPVTLNLAYFAPLNGAGRIFPVSFNYQRCMEISIIIRFWLTNSFIDILDKKKVVVEIKVSVCPDRLFAVFLAKFFIPMFY